MILIKHAFFHLTYGAQRCFDVTHQYCLDNTEQHYTDSLLYLHLCKGYTFIFTSSSILVFLLSCYKKAQVYLQPIFRKRDTTLKKI